MSSGSKNCVGGSPGILGELSFRKRCFPVFIINFFLVAQFSGTRSFYSGFYWETSTNVDTSKNFPHFFLKPPGKTLGNIDWNLHLHHQTTITLRKPVDWVVALALISKTAIFTRYSRFLLVTFSSGMKQLINVMCARVCVVKQRDPGTRR